jgi:hypothetical protein
MLTRPALHLSLLASAAAATLLTAGCATAPPTAERMVQVPMGTVTTYHRRSSGSLGSFDGQVVWTHSPATWQGRPVISYASPQAGGGLYEPPGNALVALLTPAGTPAQSFDPPIGYQWPLFVGKTWTSNHQVTLLPAGRTLTMTIDWRVESWGDVGVPAGTYKAYKLDWTSSLGEVETR